MSGKTSFYSVDLYSNIIVSHWLQLTKLCGSRAMCHAAVPHLAPESELHDASSPNSADKGDIRSYSRSQLVKLNETCSEDETAAMDDNMYIQHAQSSIGYHKDDDLHRLLLLSKGRSQWKKQGLDLLEVPALILNIEARGGSVHEKRCVSENRWFHLSCLAL
jgi:hypothetical protein